MAHLTCFIALDDTDEENGCLHHVPGSHRWPLLPVTGLAGDMDAIQTVLSDEQRAMFRPMPTKLRKGYASFHHPLTIHGSYGNTSDRPRRATVINVFRAGVTVRQECERRGGQLIRVNPRDTRAPSGSIVLPVGALQAIEAVDRMIGSM